MLEAVVKLLIAPDKFKGSLSAAGVSEALSLGWKSVLPATEISFAPMADGGEGFAEALASALVGEWVHFESVDALGRPIRCRFFFVPATQTAVLAMSEASGIERLSSLERDPYRASTFGTGLLLRRAIERGAKRVLLGLGGSATTDGGIGMAAALGYRFLSSEGELLEPLPSNLSRIATIDASDVCALPEIIAACDVKNPLLGVRGTAAIFAPQKGADAEAVRFLEKGLSHLAEIVRRELRCDFSNVPGAGAAGGIGFGLLSFCRAAMEPGFELVSKAVGLEERIAQADLVLTGEGRLDAQTLEGKGPAGIAALARAAGKPVLVFAGSIEESPDLLASFDATFPIIDRPVSLEEAMRDAPAFLHRAAARAARLISNPINP
ncbi:MAG: glycerate kinase [Verrucomicrobia bacterium]|nr:MAG: glycerate kinase [Verrucomicrobiota bacterium]